MPELPEMENYKILLAQKIQGQTITDLHINRDKTVNVSSETFIKQVRMQEVVAIERKAKHLLFHLKNGYVLLLHLMLGGLMFYGMEENKPDRTIQVQLIFGSKNLYFIGLRLGYLHIFDKEGVRQELEDLGPEPLDGNFTVDSFLKHSASKRGRIKTTLVDQKFLSGIGNRYVDEICYHAQILPMRNMNELQHVEAVQLYNSIRYVLNQAIKLGGYMDTPLFENDAKTGGYQAYFKVYNREGETCERCGAKIIKEKISSRKTFYCRGCQR